MMKRMAFLLTVALSLLLCTQMTAKKRQYKKTVTLVYYDVKTLNKFMDNSGPLVAEILTLSGADYMALVALDSCNTRNNTFQLKDLADLLGADQYHYAPCFPYKGGSYGNGVILKNPIIKKDIIRLPAFSGHELRSVAVIETEDCIVASTQLSPDAAGAKQAEVINNWFMEHYAGCGKPVFLCGHMGALPDSETIGVLMKRWRMLSNVDIPNYPAKNADRCFGYILALKKGAKVKVMDATVLRSNANKTNFKKASDHLPVSVTVSF